MREAYGDLWDYEKDPDTIICIPTNGTLAGSGNGVMGRGVAAQARDKWPELPRHLGASLRQFGNHCVLWTGPRRPLVYFPVKHHWRDRADLNLIQRSAGELADISGWWTHHQFILPRPGCGNGRLNWEQVRPVIEGILPDNVTVINREIEWL